MPRNHPWINQTSTTLLQSWRGNCDIQILIYDSPPNAVNIKEISKVTDYVVAYSCKGNTTLQEEKETNKKMLLAMEETTGDTDDLKHACKKIMNKAAARRLISKQEASVLLGDLSLTLCSEYIEPVSISNSIKVKVSKDDKVDTRFLQQYAKRDRKYYDCSLHEFYVIF